jgi:hypothetical protein
MTRASRITTPPASGLGLVIAVTTSPARTGVATPMTAESTTVSRNTAIAAR